MTTSSPVMSTTPTPACGPLRVRLCDHAPVDRVGVVQVGSFPSDDTQPMVVSMTSGRRLDLLIILSETPKREAEEQLSAPGVDSTGHDGSTFAEGSIDPDRWDDESPAG
jgi:hypothetical protein